MNLRRFALAAIATLGLTAGVAAYTVPTPIMDLVNATVRQAGALVGIPVATLQTRARPTAWGADPTCSTDSTAAFVAMFGALLPGSKVDIGGDCYIVGNMAIPDNVTAEGNLDFGDPLVLANIGMQPNPYAWRSQLRTLPGTTITFGNGSRFLNGVIIPTGLGALPVTTQAQAAALLAKFAGTAITADGKSVDVDHSAILGYAQAIHLTNSGGAALSSKARITNNIIDSLSGVWYGYSGDRGEVSRNHIFPFLTVGIAGGNTVNQQRSGTCIDMEGPDTASTVFDNLCFGFGQGGVNNGSSAVTWLRNHFENFVTSGGSASTGLTLGGQYLDAHDNLVIGYPTGISVDAQGAPVGNDTFKLLGNTVIGLSGTSTCILQNTGFLIAEGNFLQNCGTVAQANAGATGGVIEGNRVTGAITGFVNNSTAPASAFTVRDNPGLNATNGTVPSPAYFSTVSANFQANGSAGSASSATEVDGSAANGANDLKLGVDTSTAFGPNGAGWLQATSEGRSHTPLVLNPLGGAVQVGPGGLTVGPGVGSVTCSGAPTSSFNVTGGVVTHC